MTKTAVRQCQSSAWEETSTMTRRVTLCHCVFLHATSCVTCRIAI